MAHLDAQKGDFVRGTLTNKFGKAQFFKIPDLIRIRMIMASKNVYRLHGPIKECTCKYFDVKGGGNRV